MRSRLMTGLLGGGLIIGVVAFGAGLIYTPGDYELSRLAHGLDATGVETTARDAEIWHRCTYKGCTDSDHVRAVVELPSGPDRVTLRGSRPVVDDLPESAWSAATPETGYDGTVDVVFDAADPGGTVMATADVASWVTGYSSTTVTEDVVAIVISAAVALGCGWALAWRAGFRMRRAVVGRRGRHAGA
ncbi:hypothetical protein IC607_02270 [Cellulomonas sp. JH27-2]|uniref:hypothetical protein n=1 Tax=Cellulomonas sp. JH27-2 TaxID=2774139 RepID=UPI001781F89A|nr:hypothetical protein [Cellulomonas sp. JH27-2]MBD8057791.1 hypothetical protein [Cellulomonas sp. JH27-2]